MKFIGLFCIGFVSFSYTFKLHAQEIQDKLGQQEKIETIPEVRPSILPPINETPPPQKKMKAKLQTVGLIEENEQAPEGKEAIPSQSLNEKKLNSAFGKKSEQEATQLYSLGKKAFESKDFEESNQYFRRLLDRYPHFLNKHEVTFNLGFGLFNTQKTRKAIQYFRQFIKFAPSSPESFNARILLIQSYMDLLEWNHAEIVALEVIQSPLKAVTDETRVNASLLRAIILLKTSREQMSEGLFSSIKSNRDLIEKNPHLQALKGYLEISLKLNLCEKYPSAKRLNESETKDQLDRKGLCIIEATLPLREVFLTGDLPNSEASFFLMQKGVLNLIKVCTTPPLPVIELSKQEQLQYQKELSKNLKKSCLTYIERIQEMVESWNFQTSQELQKQKTNLEKILTQQKALIQLIEKRKQELL